MKKISTFVIVMILFFKPAYSQLVNVLEVMEVSKIKLINLNKNEEFKIKVAVPIYDGKEILAYVVHLEPFGFIVVSGSKSISPILAYSFESDFGELNRNNVLYTMLNNDLINQKRYVESKSNDYAQINYQKWLNFLQSNFIQNVDILEQWPSTGNGWLQTNWTQTSPYSNFCPIDPITSQRSYAGCPATAMAQILNFHRTINGTHFSNIDDYFHNYAGRQFNIDDDSGDFGFPSFPELNACLDTLQNHWNYDMPLNNNDKAALTFACGVAAKQVFTSEGSGTFSVSQAFDAYQRFGCETSVLIQADDSTLIDRLMQNIKDTLPAHLAIVDSAWSTGHNVVVDGYNSDGYFHVNFGWGGSANAWYLLPQDLPYELTSFEGVVLDIMKKSSVDISENRNQTRLLEVYPNPFINEVNFTINYQTSDNSLLMIYNVSGQLIYVNSFNTCNRNITVNFDENKSQGVYFYHYSNDAFSVRGKIIRQ